MRSNLPFNHQSLSPLKASRKDRMERREYRYELFCR